MQVHVKQNLLFSRNVLIKYSALLVLNVFDTTYLFESVYLIYYHSYIFAAFAVLKNIIGEYYLVSVGFRKSVI